MFRYKNEWSTDKHYKLQNLEMWQGMCTMGLQILWELFKSKVVVWIAKIRKDGHDLFKIKGMAT